MNFSGSLETKRYVSFTVLLITAVHFLFTVLGRVGVVNMELCSALDDSLMCALASSLVCPCCTGAEERG